MTDPLSLSSLLMTGVLLLLVSFSFSMLGLGGGMLYVPIFKWMGLPLKTLAIPLGLLLNGLTTLTALLRYHREGLVEYRAGAPAAVAALLLAPLGALCVERIPRKLLLGLFIAAILVAAWRSLTTARHTPRHDLSRRQRLLIGMGTGGTAGFIAGLLGIGGGFIIAPMLMELGFPGKQAAGTTSLIACLSSFSGFLGHVGMGHIEPHLALVSGAAVIVGSALGSWFMATRANSAWIKRLYGILLLAVAAKLLYGLLST